MFYLNNSETSWLVYADWLEDQDIDATHIRQEVVNPTTNGWNYERYVNLFLGKVGTYNDERSCVGSYYPGCVGDNEMDFTRNHSFFINVDRVGSLSSFGGVGV